MGGRNCSGHDRLDVSLVLAWGRMMVGRKKVESPLTSVVERTEISLLGNQQLTRRRRMDHRSPTKSKELAEIKAVASLK